MNSHRQPWAFVATIAVLASSPTWAHDPEEKDPNHTHAPRPVPAAVEHKPSALPDRVILTWAGDPRFTQAVTWRTDGTVETAFAEIAEAEDGPKFPAKARRVEARTEELGTELAHSHYHSAQFEGLKPNTRYVYRVGDGVNWSEWFQFRTTADSAEPFKFIYFGDAQNDLKAMWSRVMREAFSDAPRSRFIIHAGDLINNANNDAQWGEWHRAGGWVNAMIPSIPVPGNHEYEKDKTTGQSSLTRHWRPQFTLPTHGPSGLEECAYFVDVQGTRIIGLNSNLKQPEQASWLEKILSDNPNTWTIITFHHPIYSSAKDRDNPTLRATWQPIFDKYKVDLVLQGHDHTYARSGPRVSENVAVGVSQFDPNIGTVYVVSVSGPKMYNLTTQPWMKRSAEDTQLYQVISIDGPTLRYEARTAKGSLYDAFELRKRSGMANLMIDKAPATPENRRPPSETKAAETDAATKKAAAVPAEVKR